MMSKWLLLLTVGALVAALSPSPALAGNLYAISGAAQTDSYLYRLDPATGAVIQTIGSQGLSGESQISSLAFDPVSGTLYAYVNEYVSYNEGALATIDIATGLATIVGVSTPVHVPDLAFSPSGTLYGWTEGGTWSDDLVTFDTTTGAVTWVGESGIDTYATGLECDSASNLYVKDAYDVYTVDPFTGAATFLVSLSAETKNGLAFDQNGSLFGLYRDDTTSYLLSIDLGLGAVTTIGDIGVPHISCLAFQRGGSPVDETSWGAIKALFR